MRIYSTIILIALLSCGEPETEPPPLASSFDSVTVGMPYDEVTRLLGKPAQIARGINSLAPEPREPLSPTRYTVSEINTISREFSFVRQFLDTTKEKNVWPRPMQVSAKDQSLYCSHCRVVHR